ncbi:MAG: hypothetical protein WA324_13715, partial [Bryobacteraceae bacterium]
LQRVSGLRIELHRNSYTSHVSSVREIPINIKNYLDDVLGSIQRAGKDDRGLDTWTITNNSGRKFVGEVEFQAGI